MAWPPAARDVIIGTSPRTQARACSMAGAGVVGTDRLEEVEHVCRARRRPEREEVMVGVREDPAPPDRDEAGIADLRKDHASIFPPTGGADVRSCWPCS